MLLVDIDAFKSKQLHSDMQQKATYGYFDQLQDWRYKYLNQKITPAVRKRVARQITSISSGFTSPSLLAVLPSIAWTLLLSSWISFCCNTSSSCISSLSCLAEGMRLRWGSFLIFSSWWKAFLVLVKTRSAGTVAKCHAIHRNNMKTDTWTQNNIWKSITGPQWLFRTTEQAQLFEQALWLR